MNKHLPPALPNLSDDLVKRIAMDIGKDVVTHLKFVYREIMEKAPSTFEVTIRNGIYNRIMAAVKTANEGNTEAQLELNAKHRQRMTKFNKHQPR